MSTLDRVLEYLEQPFDERNFSDGINFTTGTGTKFLSECTVVFLSNFLNQGFSLGAMFSMFLPVCVLMIDVDLS